MWMNYSAYFKGMVCTMLGRSLLIALCAIYMSSVSASGQRAFVDTTSGLGIDAIYVIGIEKCEERWRRAYAWAEENMLEITPIHATTFDKIKLHQPPIPISHIPATDEITTGRVACTSSHIRTWRHAFTRNYSLILVLEDDVRLTPSLMSRIPLILSDARAGSQQRNWMPWHYMFLRMHSTVVSKRKHRLTWHGQVRVAIPGWGTAAYLVSNAGIRYLLTRVTKYSFPLDVQIERLQRGFDTQGAKFIALDVCDIQEKDTRILGCPENIQELTLLERGNCYYSASQMGKVANGSEFPGSVNR